MWSNEFWWYWFEMLSSIWTKNNKQNGLCSTWLTTRNMCKYYSNWWMTVHWRLASPIRTLIEKHIKCRLVKIINNSKCDYHHSHVLYKYLSQWKWIHLPCCIMKKKVRTPQTLFGQPKIHKKKHITENNPERYNKHCTMNVINVAWGDYSRCRAYLGNLLCTEYHWFVRCDDDPPDWSTLFWLRPAIRISIRRYTDNKKKAI